MASRIHTHLLLHGLHAVDNEGQSWVNSSWTPPVDVYELKDCILIQVEAPGLRLENLQIQYEPGELIVQGQREKPQLPGPARAALVEMNYGPFKRKFVLPHDADGEGIQATYDLGVLQIRVPRRPATAPVFVQINSR